MPITMQATPLLLSIILLALVSLAEAQVATPPRPVGFVYNGGSLAAKVHLDVYLCPLCPDSRMAWPTLKEVAQHYSAEDVRLNVHIFPLPYHMNAFSTARTIHIVHKISNGTKTFEWLEKIMLDNIAEMTDVVYHNKTGADLLDKYEELANDIGLNGTLVAQLADRRIYNVYEKYSRVMWKHGCVRGVAEVPTYIVNGIIQPSKQWWRLQEWQQFLDNLLTPKLFDDVSGRPSDYDDNSSSFCPGCDLY